MRSLLLRVLVLLLGAVPRGWAEEFALRDGDTVAFLGDSITAARGYSRVIENYTLLRFPERKIRFFNAGRGGETAKGALSRLDEAVLGRGATVLTVAYGINDIGWGTKADEAHRREHLESVREIVRRCREKGVRVYVCSAAITAEDPATAEQGFLQKMGDDALAQARELGAGAIDVQRGMRAVQRRMLAAGAAEKDERKRPRMHADDGVHLNDLGQMAMAVTILKGLGAPADVSWATIDAGRAEAVQTESCTISGISGDDRALRFVRLDSRQPLNLQPLWMLMGFHIPITDELNRYGLTVRGLAEGRWEILAGGRPLGTWTASQLADGINLASASGEPWEPGGPWHAQAQLLKTITDLRDEIDWTRRDLPRLLAGHPERDALAEDARKIEDALQSLQRRLARPVDTEFILRRVAEKP